MEKTAQDNAPAPVVERNLIDDLVAETGAESGAETWEYESSTKRVWRFRAVRSSKRLAKALKRAQTLLKRTKANTPDTWHKHLPLDEQTARAVAFLEESMVEPKLSTLQLLELSERAGALFLEISGKVLGHAFNLQAARDEEEIDELGEDSGETDTDGISSPSPATAGESTSAN